MIQAKKRLTELQKMRNQLLVVLLKDGVLEGSVVMDALYKVGHFKPMKN